MDTNSVFYQILETSKNEKELIGIWEYSDEDNFSAGYVLDFDQDIIYLKHFTKYGKPDGIITLKTEDIQSIDFNDDYLKALDCLIQYSDIVYKEEPLSIDYSFTENLNYDIIKQAYEKDIFISLKMEDEKFYSGYITNFSTTDFSINCVGKMGEDEGHVIFRITDINQIKINDIDDRRRKLLYNWRKTNL